MVVAPLAAAFAAAMFVVTTSRAEVYGAIDGRAWLMVATCAVLGAGGLALGVALGRFAPFSPPALALIIIVFLDGRILELGGVRWATDRYLATFDPGDGPDQVLLDLPVAERLVWFVGLTVIVIAVALVGRRRWALPALGVGVAVAMLGAVGVTAPMSGTVEPVPRISSIRRGARNASLSRAGRFPLRCVARGTTAAPGALQVDVHGPLEIALGELLRCAHIDHEPLLLESQLGRRRAGRNATLPGGEGGVAALGRAFVVR